jgi:hypothetical protein
MPFQPEIGQELVIDGVNYAPALASAVAPVLTGVSKTPGRGSVTRGT